MKNVEISSYDQQAKNFADKHHLTLLIGKNPVFKAYFPDDKARGISRYVFPCTLVRGDNRYSFQFGQSQYNGKKEPSMYDILSCLQKYDIGTLNDFITEFGYKDKAVAQRVYTQVRREYEAMCRLFTPEELQEMAEIA